MVPEDEKLVGAGSLAAIPSSRVTGTFQPFQPFGLVARTSEL